MRVEVGEVMVVVLLLLLLAREEGLLLGAGKNMRVVDGMIAVFLILELLMLDFGCFWSPPGTPWTRYQSLLPPEAGTRKHLESTS